MNAKSLIDACANLLQAVLRFQHPADAELSRYFREHRNLGSRERATLAETAYNVLRQKNRFEFLARSGSGARERKLAILGFAGAPDFLQTGLSAQEKSWLEECLNAKESDFNDLHRHNFPDWLAQKLTAELGVEKFWSVAQASSQAAALDLRVNTMKSKREAVQALLKAEGITSDRTPYSPWGLRIKGRPNISRLESFKSGDFEVQDEGSQLLAILLGAKRGEMVVDFCAGAGGKTLAIGAQMRSTGRLYAMDISAHRLDSLKPRLARSGLSNVHSVVIAHERDERIKRLYGKIDRVLVDAPCSGLGTLRRNPDLKWRQNEKIIAEVVEKQKLILDSAAKLLKTGGRLVYATCSILRCENEDVADAFSAAHEDFKKINTAEILENETLCIDDNLRLWPDTHNTDGFFAAVWEKK